MKRQILSIKIRHMADDSPDTSWLGEYTDNLEPGVIVRRYGEFFERLDDDDAIPGRGREFRGFKPYAGEEPVGTDAYYEYGMQDYLRMEGLNRGDWQFLGVRAEAKVILDGNLIQTITSGGLWGIESDSGAYLDEVADEQLDELYKQLRAVGFGDAEIEAAIDAMDREVVYA